MGDGSDELIKSRSVLAYLGPAGTYSHQVFLLCTYSWAAALSHFLQAGHDRFAETVDYQPRNTISGLCRTREVLRVVREN
jgi:hypothetical protein